MSRTLHPVSRAPERIPPREHAEHAALDDAMSMVVASRAPSFPGAGLTPVVAGSSVVKRWC